MNFRKYRPDGPPDPAAVIQLKVHGGLGDIIWLHRAAVNFPKPVFYRISSENRTRPRRSGILVDHLPNVAGWAWDDTAFCPNGDDWPHPDDPCCAIGRAYADLGLDDGRVHRLECNRWLEGGRRLEGWLPDVAKTFHFPFDPCPPPARPVETPCVVLHLAGWPDVPDPVWINAANMFRGLAHVYVAGGSYDFRPRQIFNMVSRVGGVSLLEDVGWADLVGVLTACDYCFGHASGLTALADVLRVRGAVFNPRSVPNLVGTWNSPDNPGLLHLSRVPEFEAAVYAAYQTVSAAGRATWPPTAPRGPRIDVPEATDDPAAAAVRAAAGAGGRAVALWAATPAPPALPAAVLDGAYRAGRYVTRLFMVGYPPDALARVYAEAQRSTRRPAVETDPGPWPGRGRAEVFDLIVLYAPAEPAAAADCVRRVWPQVAPGGTLLVGSSAGAAGIESLAAGLRVTSAAVQNAPGWHYLHKRLG